MITIKAFLTGIIWGAVEDSSYWYFLEKNLAFDTVRFRKKDYMQI